MNDSFFLTAFRWLGNHKPDVMIFLIILFSAIWLNTQFNDFGRRIDKVEFRLDKVEYRLDKVEEDIAEIRADVKVMKEEMSEIKAFMIKIDTYLSTTNKDYPKR